MEAKYRELKLYYKKYSEWISGVYCQEIYSLSMTNYFEKIFVL